jgi:hypothetical protein
MFMNRYVNIGMAFGMSAFLGAAMVSAQAKPDTAKPATEKPQAKPTGQPQTAKPATEKPQTAKPAADRPMAKPAMEQSSAQAGGAVNLGSVRIPRDVKGGGQALPAGTYQVRVTETPATPPAPGQTPQYERWAEFLRNGKVVAREVVTVVPASDIKQVAEQTPPPSGGYRAEVLKGNDYLRLWINRGGNHYLVHFNI